MTHILGQDQNRSAIKLAVDSNLPILLVGDTGTGKTSIVREVAEGFKTQVMRVNLNGQTSVDEFVDKYLIKNRQTVWVDGVLIQAMKNGWWLLCDEINAALPEILFVLHSLLDDDRMVVLSEKDGEIVKPHENFRFFATMNPNDEYTGTKELNKAFVSRFAMVLQFHYPESHIEKEIIMSRTGIDNASAMIMVDFANRVRKEKADENVFFTISTRDLLYWAEITTKTDIPTAFNNCILNKANPADREILIKILGSLVRSLEGMLKAFDKPDIQELLKEIYETAHQLTVKSKEMQTTVALLEERKRNLLTNFEEYKKAQLDEIRMNVFAEIDEEIDKKINNKKKKS